MIDTTTRYMIEPNGGPLSPSWEPRYRVREGGPIGGVRFRGTREECQAWIDARTATTREPINCPGHDRFTDCEDYGPEGTCTACDAAEDATAVDPDAWTVDNVAHCTTGQTIAPDSQTGDEWAIEWTNPTVPTARVVTTFGVTRYPTDEDGGRLDPWELPDEETHPFWRYAVEEVTELVTSTTPDDFWAHADQAAMEYGEGSYLDFDTEEAADRECEAMARRAAGMTGIISWNGQPS